MKAIHLLLLTATAALASYSPYYDTTWAGPAQVQQNGTSPFTFVEATLVMPHLELPKNPHEVVDQYTASYWIGIDGWQSPPHSGLWQAGVSMHIFTNGTTEFVGFWEWVPDPETFLYDNFTILEGHHIHVTLNTTANGTSASTTLKNLNTTQITGTTRAAPTSWRGPDWTAPGASAEWIVESGTYPNYTKTVLPDWGTAVFLSAQACREDGSCILPGDGNTTQMFINFWLDTEILYSNSSIQDGIVRVNYIEEQCETCKMECLAAGSCFNSTTR